MDFTPKLSLEDLPVSFGVQSILSTLIAAVESNVKVDWNVVLINIETLMRNNVRTADKEDIPLRVERVVMDMGYLAQYFSALVRQTNLNKITIVYYLPDYTKIPSNYKKDKTNSLISTTNTYRGKMLDFLKKTKLDWNFDKVELRLAVVDGPWPHQNLRTELTRILGRLNLKNAVMISHAAIDFHLYKHFHSFSVLESFTGKIKTRRQFGMKVFGNADVPFNKYTHLLLGDKLYLKSQLTSKQKKDLIEHAQKEKWNLLPDLTVAEKIINLHYVNKELFLQPDI
jgi:hypothetical protein